MDPIHLARLSRQTFHIQGGLVFGRFDKAMALLLSQSSTKLISTQGIPHIAQVLNEEGALVHFVTRWRHGLLLLLFLFHIRHH